LSTILHEATHNLGPAHEYKYKGKTDSQWFGGGLASMMEELKAQTGALYLVDFVKQRSIIDAELARRTYTESIVWAFGHISRGMYTSTGGRKAYSQLAAIQIGFLLDEGALGWDANAKAANERDLGAFTIHFDSPGAIERDDEGCRWAQGFGRQGGRRGPREEIRRWHRRAAEHHHRAPAT
jgi:hypothetical protein